MVLALAAMALTLCGCGSANGSGRPSGGPSTDDLYSPTALYSSFHEDALQGSPSAGIDASAVNDGYVGACAISDSRIKLMVTCEGQTYYYDVPNDGTPVICPLNMGSGHYVFSIMQNIAGSRYAQLFSTSADVALSSEEAPFLVPNLFCDYDADSACVAKAQQLISSAHNQAEALDAIYNYVVGNITYDTAKAAQLAGGSGYIPDPDNTLETGTGICFDYASLCAAMLRSVGIPCKIITGYVSPGDLYHAWNMVLIDGSWETVEFAAEPGVWSRIDTTFAASGALATVGDGASYADRYVY